MTTAAIVLAASLVALLATVLLVAGARRRRAAEARLETALARLGNRVDELSDDLADALEHVREDARRVRALAALGRSFDPDEVVARAVDAACALPGVAAAVARCVDLDGRPRLAARGVPPEPATEHAISGPPDGSAVRAVACSYHYHSQPAPGSFRSAIAVPLERGGSGFLSVYSESDDAALAPETFAMLEAIAEQAGEALERAYELGAAKQRPAGTVVGLPGRRGFHDALVREVERAHRSRGELSLVLFDIDGLSEITRAQGHAAGEESLDELEQALLEVTRATDHVYRVGADAFAVILVAAGRIEAEAEFARVQAKLSRGPRRAQHALAVSGGIGELREDDDAVALLDRTTAALRRAKEQGKGTAA